MATAGHAVGVTNDAIVVSIVQGFSGAYGPVINRATEGFETWLDDVNEKGGIHGRKVVAKRVDHKETVEGGVAACKEALSNGSFFVGVPEGQGANLTAVDCLDRGGMPTLYFAGINQPEWKQAFSYIPSSVAQGTSLSSYVRNVLHDGAKKLGVMYLNLPAYEPAREAYVRTARALGMKVVAQEAVDVNQASFTPQLLRMRQAGVENIAIMATIEAIGILRDARALGYNPHFTGLGWIFDFITAAARQTADGVTGMKFSAAVDGAAYDAYSKRMAARGRGRARSSDLEGEILYGFGVLLGKVLEAAGPVPTRQSLISGAQTIRQYDNGILPPITYGPGDHVGTTASFPVVCCNSDYTWKGQGPARESF